MSGMLPHTWITLSLLGLISHTPVSISQLMVWQPILMNPPPRPVSQPLQLLLPSQLPTVHWAKKTDSLNCQPSNKLDAVHRLHPTSILPICSTIPPQSILSIIMHTRDPSAALPTTPTPLPTFRRDMVRVSKVISSQSIQWLVLNNHKARAWVPRAMDSEMACTTTCRLPTFIIHTSR